MSCAFQDEADEIQHEFTEEHNRLETDSLRAVLEKPTTSRKIWGSKGPSLGVIQRTGPHERSPNGPKFEDRSQEETERPERCTRRELRTAKSVKAQIWTKSPSSHLLRLGVFKYHPYNQMEENMW